MTEEDALGEIRSTFQVAMGNGNNFPFRFLQMARGGSKSLTIPVLSASFYYILKVHCTFSPITDPLNQSSTKHARISYQSFMSQQKSPQHSPKLGENTYGKIACMHLSNVDLLQEIASRFSSLESQPLMRGGGGGGAEENTFTLG